jgi:hypothetical protein
LEAGRFKYCLASEPSSVEKWNNNNDKQEIYYPGLLNHIKISFVEHGEPFVLQTYNYYLFHPAFNELIFDLD